MKTLFTLFSFVIVLFGCVKHSTVEPPQTPTQPFTSQSGNGLYWTTGMKLSIKTFFVYDREAVTVNVARYDSVNSTLQLQQSMAFGITNPNTSSLYNHVGYTGFDYKGTIRIRLISDVTTTTFYDRWVTLTNKSGLILNYDTCGVAVAGLGPSCKVSDVVPKHY